MPRKQLASAKDAENQSIEIEEFFQKFLCLFGSNGLCISVFRSWSLFESKKKENYGRKNLYSSKVSCKEKILISLKKDQRPRGNPEITKYSTIEACLKFDTVRAGNFIPGNPLHEIISQFHLKHIKHMAVTMSWNLPDLSNFDRFALNIKCQEVKSENSILPHVYAP